MNWLESINYIIKNPNEKLYNEDTKLYLYNNDGIPMILEQRGVYKSIDLDRKFCRLQWRIPITLTKYNISVYVDNCLINNHEEWVNSNKLEEYMNKLISRVFKEYNPHAQDFRVNVIGNNAIYSSSVHEVKVNYEPMFDENLNIIRKEE